MTSSTHLMAGVLVASVLVVGSCSSRADTLASEGDDAADDGAAIDPANPSEMDESESSPTESLPDEVDSRETPQPGPLTGPDVESVRIEDPTGDPVGGSAPTTPELVDLSAVTVSVDGTMLQIDYELVAPPPLSRGPAVLNLVTFLDTDCDGIADHEFWATLTDEGWEPSTFQRTEGGQMGVQPADGVSIRADRSTVTVTGPVPEGAANFDWMAAAEDGLVADYRSGDTWRDLVPDATADNVGTCTSEQSP